MKLEQQLAVLTAKREKLFRRVQLLYDLSLQLADETKLAQFKTRYKNLEDTFKQFETVQDDILSVSLQIDAETSLDLTKQSTDSFEELYFNIKSTYDNLTSDEVNTGEAGNSSEQKVVRPRLPQIDLPKFDGSYNAWTPFYDNFRVLIHENSALNDIEKFHYLLSVLSGSAISIGRSLPISEKNYSVVWNALVSKYQNKRVLGISLLDAVFNCSPQQHESASTLNTFLTHFYEPVTALKALQIPDLADFLLMYIALKNLPATTRKQFELQNMECEIPTFENLASFLQSHARILEISHGDQPDFNKHGYKKPTQKNMLPANRVPPVKYPHTPSRVLFTAASNASKPCPCCRQSHTIFKCPDFQRMTPFKRKDLVKAKNLCLNCLKDTHQLSLCSSKTNCLTCNKRHHTYLHFEFKQPNEDSNRPTTTSVQAAPAHSPSTISSPSSKQASATLVQESKKSCTVILGTAVIHVKDSNDVFQPVRAIIDSCAQTSFMSSACANRLGLSRRKCNIPISGLAQSNVTDTKGIVSCLLKPRDSPGPLLNTEAVILLRITADMPSITIPNHVISKYKHLYLADPNFHIPSQIDFLIAADLFPDIYEGQRINTGVGYPSALSSIFGWIITGKLESFTLHSSLQSSCLLTTMENSLETVIRKFWEIEEVPRTIPLNPDDILCENIFETEHYREHSGRYVVPLPVKESDNCLGNSFDQAMSRLRSLQRKLNREPDLHEDYRLFMEEYEFLGHMTPVKSTLKPQGTYFIPHHCVIKDSSSSTRVRVVFDASMKTTSNRSLNDILLIGPKLQNGVADILMTFRLHNVVFTADISKMYRQILIRPQDRTYQHILWQKGPEEPIQEFELNTVTYGLSSAPYLALRTLKQLAIDEGDTFPLAAKVLKEDIYIDDILTGTSDLQEALDTQQQLIDLLALGGFSLHKWSSNHDGLLQAIPQQSREVPLSLDGEGSDIIKILGLQWTAKNDVFSYNIMPIDVTYTKRSILSHVCRIFDPLGWLSPVIILAKILIQKLWMLGLGWDDIIPQTIQQDWYTFASELSHLSEVKIDRFMASSKSGSCYLVGFCDASEQGYSAVIYLVEEHSSQRPRIHLVIAKSKVAPLKKLSVPRLELCGAVLLSRLFEAVQKVLCKILEIKVFLAFTDSMTVLSWLKTPPYLLKTYVANRVTEILEYIRPDCWHHVSSHENPADCSSRGLYPSQLLNHPLWWTGPPWMSKDISDWPLRSPPYLEINCLPETKISGENTIVAEVHKSDFDLDHRISSFIRLIRVTAWCQRFIKNLRLPRSQQVKEPLTTNELNLSVKFWIKRTQHESFQKDLKLINRGKQTSSAVRKLNPFLDKDGILRVGGRLRNAAVSEDFRHPILLPKSSQLTKLLIDHYHKSYLHVGPRTLQSLIQQKYWILSMRNAIRSRLVKCLTCHKLKSASAQPRMGDLPPSRVCQGRPFINVGIDFGGPIWIKESTRRNAKLSKAYICLFICLSTKAVHVEVVSDLTTDAFLASLDRFTSRRGMCHHIYTDNGTNFVGASKYLAGIFKFFEIAEHKEGIVNHCSQQGITWNFNPPSAPHFGGLWEAGIRSTKYHLKRVLNDRAFTFEELSTLCAKIEAILNSRPLCPLSTDPNEFDVLTPGHFLIGSAITAIPERDLQEVPVNRLTRWQLISQATQHFWKRYKDDYLHTLQQRNKWTSDQPNLTTGDLVLLQDIQASPLQWKLGRIEEIFPGKDGIVRVVTVRTAKGIYKRPVVKISPLPFSN